MRAAAKVRFGSAKHDLPKGFGKSEGLGHFRAAVDNATSCDANSHANPPMTVTVVPNTLPAEIPQDFLIGTP